MRKVQALLFVAWAVLIFLTVKAFNEMNALQAAVKFYEDIINYSWRAQLNFDFQIYLIIAALWVFYREKNFVTGLVFAVLALAGGNLFLAPYLIYLISCTKGDVRKILLGKHYN